MGMVEMKQGEGTYVKGLSLSKFPSPFRLHFDEKKDVAELLEVRKYLNRAVSSAAQNARRMISDACRKHLRI
ncbi:hypothetical protein PO124_11305 [Bacillus licheniformis]|nr:hypothetical protein [Bacillus licheniformis]